MTVNLLRMRCHNQNNNENNPQRQKKLTNKISLSRHDIAGQYSDEDHRHVSGRRRT